MVFRIVVMPSAQDDMDEYAAFIAKDSERYAAEWLTKAWEVIFSLADNPKRFAVIPETGELNIEVRGVVHFSHRIVYLVKDKENTVEVLRVYHGAHRPLTSRDL